MQEMLGTVLIVVMLWLLIESTLRLWRWKGRSWVRSLLHDPLPLPRGLSGSPPPPWPSNPNNKFAGWIPVSPFRLIPGPRTKRGP